MLTVAAYRGLPGYDPSPVMIAYEEELAGVARRAAGGATVLVAVDESDRVAGAVAFVLDPGDYFEHEYGVDGTAGSACSPSLPPRRGAAPDECSSRSASHAPAPPAGRGS